MPVIRITDTTWDRLKRWAVPLEDSPEDAVRKVLDAAEEHLKCPGGKLIEPPPGPKPPLSKYGNYELNGVRITVADLWRKMGATVKTEEYISAAGVKRRASVALFNGIRYVDAAASHEGKALSKHDGKPSPLLPWIANNPNIRFVK